MAYAWGRWVQWRMTMHNLLTDPQRIADLLTKYAKIKGIALEPQEIEVRVEWIEDHCYLYRKDTGEFLGQGRDITEAVNNIDSRGIEGDFIIPKEMANKPEQGQP